MRITLDKPHTHAGKLLPKGTTFEVNLIEGEWLCLREVGHRTTPADLAQHANASTGANTGADHTAEASDEAAADHTQAGV
jgi:hypothetical protein